MNVVIRLPIFKENVCRLCATNIENNDKLFPIFDSGVNEVGIGIKEILPALDIKLDDLKPQHICLDCFDKLNICRKFLHCCIESDFKFDSYIQQCQVEEEDEILKSSMAAAYSLGHCEWETELEKDSSSDEIQQNNGVLVLSNVGSTVHDTSGQDYVVMVELKYKEELPQLADLSQINSTGTFEPYQDLSDEVQSIDSLEDKGMSRSVHKQGKDDCTGETSRNSDITTNLTSTKPKVSESTNIDKCKLGHEASTSSPIGDSGRQESKCSNVPSVNASSRGEQGSLHT